MKYLLLITLSILFASCATSSKKQNPNEHIYWVNSLKTKCVGVGPMQCLQIQKGEVLQAEKWELFYSAIDGFEYEQGYIYKLVVQEEEIPVDKVPADGSSIKYTLIKVLEKQQDTKLRLHDIWALQSIGGQQYKANSTPKHPMMEINLTENKVMGNDGCNNFFGDIKTVDNTQLVFGLLAGTRMACPNMEVSDKFNKGMSQAQSYKMEELKLHLYDHEGKELLKFKKVD